MSLFIRKPVVVEAQQWFWGIEVEGVYFDSDKWGHFVDTLQGPLQVSEGDWIITGVVGERRLCKKAVFEAIYEELS